MGWQSTPARRHPSTGRPSLPFSTAPAFATAAKKMLEAHLAFKSTATPAEWPKLRKAEEQAVAPALGKSLPQPASAGKEN